MSYKNQIELPKKNNENKKKSGLKWKYHEKFKQRYETYLIQNMNKNNLRLKGNYHYENKPVNYYLDQKESEPIKNTNLTPLPQSKYLNQKTKEKNMKDYIEFSKIQKSVVEMRRIEYNIKLVKKKEKIKIQNKEKQNDDEKKEKSINNINKIKRSIVKRKSCIQFHPSIFVLEKKRKTMSMVEIRDYIFKNINNNESEMPREVKRYLKKFREKAIIIQRRYRKHFANLKKIMKIQASFKAHFYYKLFKDYYNRKEKTKKFIYIIQKVLFLNLYHLKVNPKRKFALSKNIFTKYIYTFDSLNKIIYLQREIKYYLSCKKLKLIENKKKCVYVKPYTINPLNKIRLLQRNIVIFLERLKRRHKVQTSQMIVKRVDFSKKIILIQRLARAIHTDIIYPQILKTNFCENNIFIKSNRKYARKKCNFINTEIKPFRQKELNIKIRSTNTLITKSHKYLEKIIFFQRYIKSYLSRDDYDIYDYPKIEEYITKQSNYLPKKDHLTYLQAYIKYFLYRQKIRVNTIKKCVIEPLRCTKAIRTNTEKIFTRLSKLRILYDKDLIIFIIKIIESIRKYSWRTCYNLIKKESEKKKNSKGSLSFVKLFASSKLIKNAVNKAIEPKYKLEKESGINNKENKNDEEKNSIKINDEKEDDKDKVSDGKE